MKTRLCHIGMYLDKKLNYSHHIKYLKKLKGTGKIKLLSNIFLQNSFPAICKAILRRHLHYDDIIHD